MAKATRISFTDQQPGNFQETPSQGQMWSPGQTEWKPDFNQQYIMANAPANATPAKQITTGQDQKQDVMNGPAGYASKTREQLLEGLNPNIKYAGGQNIRPDRDSFGYQYQPKVYNQDAIDNYDKGLQQARDKYTALSPGFVDRVYQLLHGSRPEEQLTTYVPNAAMQYQTSNPNDGSVMQNPDTTPALNMQWNVDRLRQIHPDWDEDTINSYIAQPFNWQAAQALTNTGVWSPKQ